MGAGGAMLALACVPALGAPAPPARINLLNLDAQRRARALDRDADRARAADTAAEIAQLHAQLVQLGEAEANGERSVGGARGQLRRLNEQEAALRVRMGRNQDALTRLLGALETYQRHPPPALLVDARSARDAVRAAILIKAITPELERRSREFAAEAEQLKRIRRQADVASGVLFQAESDVADRRAQIEDLIEQKRALEAQLDSDADAADRDVKRLAERARSLGEFVGELNARDAPAPAELPASFRPPVQGQPVRRFGVRGGDPARAKGWTWAPEPGAPVLSPVAARVEYAGPLKGWGLVLILRVGDYHLVLAGLDSVSAAPGRDVLAGEPVGRMGAGSPSGRPELYLEVRRASRPVDPARWFAGLASRTSRG